MPCRTHRAPRIRVHERQPRGPSGARRLGDLDAATVVNAYGFNDRGEIVGMTAAGHGPQPFIYDGGVHEIAGAFGDGGAVVINNAGQVLGSGEGVCGFLTEAGQSVTLANLAASSGSQWRHMEGKAINDRGWIVGQNGGPDSHAFLMVPKETSASPVCRQSGRARGGAHTPARDCAHALNGER